jgi:peroxiredoxin/tetratricopeptide (TPR) repeat protein
VSHSVQQRIAITLILFLTNLAAAADASAPGKSAHGDAFNAGPRQAAVLLSGTGVVSFPVTTHSTEAQAFVTQGVGMLHGFWNVEAERSFRQAAALDPDCAMAYWGMTFANFDNEPRARAFIAEAVKRKDKTTPRERLYIDALDGYFNVINRDNATRRRDLVKKYEAIVHKHPTDLEAKAFLVWQLWDNDQHGVPLDSKLTIDALIGEILAVEPRHPAHHYRIHVTNPNDEPRRAFASAAACGPIAPAVPHMWHMPGHTYVAAKRYADAAWQMEAALRLENAYLTRIRFVPDESHLYVHNRSWLIDNLEYAGRVRDAIDLCKQVIELPRHPGNKTAAEARRKLLDILTRHERWEELQALEDSDYCEPTDNRAEQARRLVAFSRAALARGDRAGAIDRLAKLTDLAADSRRELAAAWAEAYGSNHLATVVAAAWASGIAASPPGFAGGVLAVERLSRKSGSTDDGLQAKADTFRATEQSFAELRGHVALANGGAKTALDWFAKAGVVDPDLLVGAYLADGNAAKAEELLRDSDGRVYRLAHRVDLLRRLGKLNEARTAFTELRALAGVADLDDPPLARLASLAASNGWPADWRTPVVAADIAARPPLESLGPIRWQPWPAPDWALPDADGRTVRFADYRSKPVVLIYYLGIGCVHCVEQLNAFTPKARDFAAAGIELIAIGTDSPDTLKGADADGKFPFTILSDRERTAFRAYRAFDDFEKMPLHGTVLIDASGRVRWMDVGPEPFTEPAFLLKEAQRLLKR